MSKIITPELITQLLQGALLPVAGAVGQSVVMIGREWINYWKMKNAVCIGEKAKEYLKQRGITDETQVRALTAKFGVLFLQGASVEDEPSLQDLWAKLLANALDPNFQIQSIRSAFFTIIRELDPNDVKILDLVHKLDLAKKPATDGKSGLTNPMYISETVKTTLGLSDEQFAISFQNLVRTGCISANIKINQNVMDYSVNDNVGQRRKYNIYASLGEQLFNITDFGVAFINACVA